jgi:UDP-N-acetyl-D-glucosamine dehydrogenase
VGVPEREDPGNAHFQAATIPKVVGGFDARSGDLACAMYANAIVKVVRASSLEVAEASKILENTYRAVNIALVNELKVLYDKLGIDVWEVIEAAKTKPFGFQAFYPGPGLGGHCIPIDPFYLTWLARKHGEQTRFIELAGEINTHMPGYVITRLAEFLNEQRKPVNGSRIAILGVAYKKDIDDPRESPSFELLRLLLSRGAELTYNDPHVPALPKMRHYPELPAMTSQELRADRDRPFGVRLRLHRPALEARAGYPERDEAGDTGAGEDSEGLSRLTLVSRSRDFFLKNQRSRYFSEC